MKKENNYMVHSSWVYWSSQFCHRKEKNHCIYIFILVALFHCYSPKKPTNSQNEKRWVAPNTWWTSSTQGHPCWSFLSPNGQPETRKFPGLTNPRGKNNLASFKHSILIALKPNNIRTWLVILDLFIWFLENTLTHCTHWSMFQS